MQIIHRATDELGSFIRQWWWLLLVGVGLGAVIAEGYLWLAQVSPEDTTLLAGLPLITVIGIVVGLLLSVALAVLFDHIRQRTTPTETPVQQRSPEDGDRAAPAHQTESVGVMRPRRPARRPRNIYLDFALRWWWLLTIGAVLGVGGGLVYVKYGPIPYRSTSLVMVSPPPSSAGGNAEASPLLQNSVANFAAQAASTHVYALASQALQGRVEISVRDLLVMQQSDELSIAPLRGTNFIAITVTDPDPEFARLVSDTIATVFVDDINGRTTTSLDERQKQLQQQIDEVRQELATAQLYQREQELTNQLRVQRSLLLELQQSYQREFQRQAEMERQLQLLTAGPVAPSPEQQAALQELAAASTRIHTQWLEIIGTQEKDIERNIAEVTAQLEQVQAELRNVPPELNPTVAAAFVDAYSKQLELLAADYAQLQLNQQSLTAPLVRWGEASPPLPVISIRKTLPISIGGGLTVAAGIALALEILRRRRERAVGAEEVLALDASSTLSRVSRNGRFAVDDWPQSPARRGVRLERTRRRHSEPAAN